MEALSYGTLLVSNQNPENVTEKFGIYVGQVLGNGFDKVDLYVDAVKSLIEDDNRRQMLAEKAIEYVKEVHNYERFDRDIMKILEHVCCHS